MLPYGAQTKALPDHILAVAGSQTYEQLGTSCHAAARDILGFGTLGLYLAGDAPCLLLSRNAPRGFLREYAQDIAHRDPLIEAAKEKKQAIPGELLSGSRDPDARSVQDLLARWKFNTNACGPIFVDSKLVGLLYTAGSNVTGCPRRRAEKLDYICQSAAIALQMILKDPFLTRQTTPRTQTSRAVGFDGLSPRLKGVALLVMQGRTNKEIARHLDISHHTVKEYISILCSRFSVKNRTGLAVALPRDPTTGSRSELAESRSPTSTAPRLVSWQTNQRCDYF